MPTRTVKKRSPKSKSKSKLDGLEGLHLTHPQRVVFPEARLTKLDLVKYYVEVAERILPQIVGRPLSLVRCPEGSGGPCFFQKHPPVGLSKDVARVKIREKSGTADYLVVHDLRGILALVQFGALELHAWGSQAERLEHPDRMIFDLDPGPGVGWKAVVDGALAVRELLDDQGLKSFVKTSGGKGLHVVVPLDSEAKWPAVKAYSKAIAARLAQDAPTRFIDVMAKAARKGRIFVDYLRNERGATAVVAYSSRARAAAGVSLPIAWNELPTSKAGDQFTLLNVPGIVARKVDPWKNIERSAASLD